MAKKKQKVVAPVVRESEVDKLRKLDDATIEEKIKEMKQELFNLRFQAAVGKLENTAQIGKTKKQTARMKTILTERVNGAK